ncbi:MAG: TIGR00730 family Rossman fold protein [Parasporobacterium sp.]|nr:TIGR00730 family Rossman fold protein [Parasporobacterium sp.]
MRVCIYGAASTQIPEIYTKTAYNLCKRLAERGHSLVFGAGDGGMMGASARGFHDAGGHVMGVAPTFFKETVIENLYEDADVIVFTESMGMRKSVMESNADAFIVMPGGIGTYDEFFQILTLKQLKVIKQPIVLFNVNHFYDPMQQLMKTAMDEKFLRSDTPGLCRIFSDTRIDELIRFIETAPLTDEGQEKVDDQYGK